MTTQKSSTNHQFCSVISKANGEDPIGSASTTHAWLVMEAALPWTEEHLHSDPILNEIHELFHKLDDRPASVMPIAIAPDKEYSVPGHIRVLYYQRPEDHFAQFSKQEFLIPESLISQFATAFTQAPQDLNQFAAYLQPDNHIRDLLVCTHGDVDVACSRFGYPIYQKLRQDDAATSTGKLRVWRCSHIGAHQFAPTLFDLPTGQFWGHLEPSILSVLVRRDNPVEHLRQFYRGWSGMTKFAQIVEREIWLQQGWDWLNYKKSGEVIAQDPIHDEWNADWAEVRIDFTSPDNSTQGSYFARVEAYAQVMTLFNSGHEQPLEAVKQYRVNQLTKTII
ncbi:sucrase ferredoxin [Nostoc sp. TCL26-01]|uniref:sucrase ferredoxin n=1 Tax=Nostoc sp. TCL26-01 TaxID=2576904 RepID=UPI0015BB87CB|nr:sucrase ferredoxin [Nostoc sp. TCL26-01]QLE57674.1 sucrase ferredoxin [Nostoc sp. TCL26-01]